MTVGAHTGATLSPCAILVLRKLVSPSHPPVEIRWTFTHCTFYFMSQSQSIASWSALRSELSVSPGTTPSSVARPPCWINAYTLAIDGRNESQAA